MVDHNHFDFDFDDDEVIPMIKLFDEQEIELLIYLLKTKKEDTESQI